ncbi:MAG TPA: transposase [Candidatus Deferrimicrobium sp.]|nr:transposase [Candidatus Deferrimicrobium sp.]
MCRGCVLRSRCTKQAVRSLTVGSNHGALRRLRADSQTDSFRQLYRRRAPVVEGVFAEAKQRHGLRRAWRRGLAKMRVQCLLMAAVINFKRLVAAFGRFLSGRSLREALWSALELLLAILHLTDNQLSPPDHRGHAHLMTA